ncbi:winged helix-turn-helix transcriptional regulator [Candidatus Woesearchaeota archaeon]|nr:MAG: winged helix-turn-helix transcriptional regulator [Candidatus Woesearchaeota archaeon]
MGYVLVAPVGDNPRALFVGMKEFPTTKAVLIAPPARYGRAKKLKKQLEQFTVPTEIIEIRGSVMEEMFRVFGALCEKYLAEEVIVNVATGDRMSTCAALSASYANGLRAFGVEGDSVMVLPILRLSYYRELSERKLRILQALDANRWTSLQQLSKALGMSAALVSYHLNGNYKYLGLRQHRLVEVKEEHQQLMVRLSQMGVLLLKGYVAQKNNR